MSYYFFFSYARDDNRLGDKAGLVKKFYDDLHEKVRVKTGLPVSEIGFFDERGIPVGAEWGPELFQAIQNSKAFVSVFSPTYFTRPVCGQEWTAFYLRQQAYAKTLADKAEKPRLMIPVLWVKEEHLRRKIPESIGIYQYKHDDFGAHYPLYGLLEILSDEGLRNAYYAKFLDAFSDNLIKAVDLHPEVPQFEYAQPLEKLKPFSQVATSATTSSPNVIYADANPRYVKFVFVVGGQKEMQEARIRQRLEYYRDSGPEWTPYLPDEKKIDLLVKGIAIEQDFSPGDAIDLNEDLLNRLEEAKSKNQIVVIVVDSWSLKIQNYQEWMNKFDEKSFLNCIVVILWINDDETTDNRLELDDFVLMTFPSRCLNKPPDFLDCVDSVDKLKVQLGKTLGEKKEKIVQLAKVQRKIGGNQQKTKPIVSVAETIG
jgi:FxsC-like protein